ncbi:amidophosphoribosyltransferase [Erysipelothrix urinaevulpis]|uniref:amidophosphoribosyltransferase n=1 Tax=Erysipelothrix urinaevulpis TaxID=2683717 RepID=UPI00135BF96D|nr:phosphoribosyltransferase family protein [Erysipelothrix urinaevulpis]
MKSIFACYSLNQDDVSDLMILGLHALQHRGEDGFKLDMKNNDEQLSVHGQGLVSTIKQPTFVADMALGVIDYQQHDDTFENQVFIEKDNLVVKRHGSGLRPLCLGKLNHTWIISTESCAIQSVGGRFIKDVLPGETLLINSNGIQQLSYQSQQQTLSLFEYIYLARPDSKLDGTLVYDSRVAMGKALYQECKIEADVVIGVPDSGVIAGLSYAQSAQIPYEKALIKNKYIHRTFITQKEKTRKLKVDMKLRLIDSLVVNKRIILVDDSIVRGITMKHLVKMFREAGAKEVHVLVTAPIIYTSTEQGIDVGDSKNLYSYQKDIEAMKKDLDCETLHFLSLENLKKSCGNLNYYEDNFYKERTRNDV